MRYSALFFGIIYGFSHQRTLNANARAAHAENEYKHKESLIQKAKLEFAKKNMPPQMKTADGGGELFQRMQRPQQLETAQHALLEIARS